MPSASELLDPDLFEQYGREEARRWALFVSRVVALAAVSSAFIDGLAAWRLGGLVVLVVSRACALAIAFAFAAYVRTTRTALEVERTDGYARGVMWLLVVSWAVDLGVSGRPPAGVAVLTALAAFFPLAMRRLGVRRWALGATTWVVVAVGARAAAHGAASLRDPSSAALIAIGPSMLGAFFALARAFATESRTSAASLESRTIGRYELVRRIGRGGMGEVWEAIHPALKVSVAVKLLRVGTAASLQRFEAEAQLTARLAHPSTVRVYDYGVVGGWLAYYVMERVPGKSLRALVEAEGRMPPARALRIVRQIALALQEAHAKRLVHRDIKPDNVLVCMECLEPDRVKVIDFGLVFDHRASHGRLTSPGTVLGTPAYLAPETSLGDAATPASDIYSLGCLAYFLLTGRQPFSGKTPQEIIAAHVMDPVPSPSKRNPAIGRALDAFVMQCMSKAPADRPTTGRPLLAALDLAEGNQQAKADELAHLPDLMAVEDGPPRKRSSVPDTGEPR